mmetsp:Transcript_109951/g.215524  ORF Transcript_109951/g.215524 Transcript_109951/m.215524 type:complete len:246 (-) Transcript_109951:677-1414(-)
MRGLVVRPRNRMMVRPPKSSGHGAQAPLHCHHVALRILLVGVLVVVVALLFFGQLLQRRMGSARRQVAAAVAAAHVEVLARLVVAEIPTAEAMSLATSGRRCAVGEGIVGQQPAVLVAHAHVQLLVHQARPGLVGASAVGGHVVAVAEDLLADGAELVPREAWMRCATRPRARADGRAALRQDAALRVAQPAVQLLAVVAHVAVVQLLLGPHRRRVLLCGRRLRLPLRLRRCRPFIARRLLLGQA